MSPNESSRPPEPGSSDPDRPPEPGGFGPGPPPEPGGSDPDRPRDPETPGPSYALEPRSTPESAGTLRFRNAFLLILVAGVSLLFFAMIRTFAVTLLLAAIFAGLMYPLHLRLLRWLGGRHSLAALGSLLAFVLLILVPLSAFLGIVAAEALQVSQSVTPWVEEQVRRPDRLDEILRRIPFLEALGPYADQILARGGEVAGRLGTFVVEKVAEITRSTVIFLFLLFVMLYAMFYFLRDGPRILRLILYYMPLSNEDEERMLGKFVSVTRAMLKGTLVIGVIQGTLAGAAFALAGIPGPVFWGTVMTVLSILPGVGAAIVWIPAVIYLFVVGQTGTAIAVALWCAAVVGTVDNVLRPRLVGRDTQMPDLMILLGTLGGLILFGAAGLLIGPIIAALFMTVWEIYGVAFREHLPAPPPLAMAVEEGLATAQREKRGKEEPPASERL